MEEKKPRWEIKYEKYLSEEPVKDKIAKLTRSQKSKITKLSKEIEALKAEKVVGDFKTREEYENALEDHRVLIESKNYELEDLKNESEANKELEGYKNFEKNKDKIKNILEYRKSLEKKLSELPKDNLKQIENKRKEQQALEARIKEYQDEIEYMKEVLKQDIPDEKRQIELFTLKTKMDMLGKLQEVQANNDREIIKLEEESKNFDEKSANKKEIYERKIAKCNIIAANLLKGKDIGEIELDVDASGKTYTSPDGKLNKKIERAKKGKVYKFDEEKGEFVEQEDYEYVEGEEMEDNKNKMPARISDFAQKFPFIAKIGNFFKNMKNKIVEYFKDDDIFEDKETRISREKIIDDIMKENEKNMSQDKSYREMISSEDKLLKEIAEKGVEKTFREKLAENRTAEANRLARQHGGRYETQDGATAKKEETLVKDEER